MMIQTIGFCRSGEWNHGGWMNTYIFPGAELPTMSLGPFRAVWPGGVWTCLGCGIGFGYPAVALSWLPIIFVVDVLQTSKF